MRGPHEPLCGAGTQVSLDVEALGQPRQPGGVVEVRVKIRENIESKKSLESGYAYPSKLNPSIWTYVTKRQFHQVSGFCVDVLSIDLAGNVNWDTVEYTKSE